MNPHITVMYANLLTFGPTRRPAPPLTLEKLSCRITSTIECYLRGWPRRTQHEQCPTRGQAIPRGRLETNEARKAFWNYMDHIIETYPLQIDHCVVRNQSNRLWQRNLWWEAVIGPIADGLAPMRPPNHEDPWMPRIVLRPPFSDEQRYLTQNHLYVVSATALEHQLVAS